jgi:hypothetical protein
MADHAWCKDTARDAAVRAAEDGRTGPLPTLGEAIAAPFACPACGGIGMDHRCKESCEQCDGSGRAIIPKTGSSSSAPDHENKGDGMATDGMRTERVTLEIVHYGPESAAGWEWKYHIRPRHIFESVRVVEEACPDAWAQTFARLEAERDAAIRERDEIRQSWLRSEESGTRLLAERNAALDAADGLRKQVAELKDKSHATWVSMNKYLCELSETRCERDEAKARVADLEAASGGGEQPRGWLTGEEREAVQWAADAAYDKQHPAEDTLRNLLARSTPPEVVLPNVYDHIGLRPVYLRADVIEALAAAGVEVKEVGK